ncbi:DNA modification system-associated small protein [Melittangium boletus]|uniref:DNA modification system-associated small protein n=1 Tax=Melittangium boletus TaxID=83453 RepID=UPI003DA469E5
MNGIKILARGPSSDLLKRHCKAIGIPVDLIRQLVEAEFEQIGKVRRRGLDDRFDEILDQYLNGDGKQAHVSEVDSAA